MGRLLHWSQPSRGLAWEALPLLGFVWGLVAHFPDKEFKAEREEHEGQTCSQSSLPSPDMGLAQQTLALCKPSVQKRVCIADTSLLHTHREV